MGLRAVVGEGGAAVVGRQETNGGGRCLGNGGIE